VDAVNTMARTIEVRVPDIGDFKDIPVIEMLVKAGDCVKEEQALVTLESDKATLDVPTPTAGRVASLAVAPGTRVSRGTLILTLEVEGSAEPAELQTPAFIEPTHNVVAIAPAARFESGPHIESEAAIERIYASPSIRRLGRELGTDLGKATGSGRGGRILAEDVHESVRAERRASTSLDIAPANRVAEPVDFAKFGEIERQPLSRIRRISGNTLARNWATIPHVTNFDEADVTDLDSFRLQLNTESAGNPKLTLLSFIVKAAAATLRFAPAFNASLDGEDLIVKKYVNVGVAVDTPGGLVVPVIRDADKLGILAIARELSQKSAEAQAGKLKLSDFEGGCFTISSLGGVGGTGFTPIINAPEIAILGVARAAIQPRYDGVQFLPKLILPLALSWDHRATDGVAAARFLVHLAALLQDFRRISL
jgi:pyruvate dehydrogenase E2 component (dihydrolipoamide acetyltransferase)